MLNLTGWKNIMLLPDYSRVSSLSRLKHGWAASSSISPCLWANPNTSSNAIVADG